jgi:hypothetical protein
MEFDRGKQLEADADAEGSSNVRYVHLRQS